MPFVRKDQDWKTLVLPLMCIACRTQACWLCYMSTLLIMRYVCSLNICFCQLTDDLKFTFNCSDVEGYYSLQCPSEWFVEQDWTVKEDHWQSVIKLSDVHWQMLTVLSEGLSPLFYERREPQSQCKMSRREEHATQFELIICMHIACQYLKH